MDNTIMYGQDAETMEKESASKAEALTETNEFNVFNPYLKFGTKMASVKKDVLSIESLMPVEDRAVLSEDDKLFIALGTEGRFRANVRNFAQVQGRCNGRIFAEIFIKEDGSRIVRFAQQYSNGNFSGVSEILQSDIVEYVSFIRQELALEKIKETTGQYKECKSAMYERAKNNAIKIFKRLQKDYSGKLKSAEVLDVNDVILDLLEVLDQLPVMYEAYSKENITPEAIYREVIQFIQKHDYDLCRAFNLIKKESYYCLDMYDIEAILYDFDGNGIAELSRLKLLKLLEEGGFLYLTPSCVGYQSEVEFPDDKGNPTRAKFYCIYKPDFLQKICSSTSAI